jgi:adenylate cyclase
LLAIALFAVALGINLTLWDSFNTVLPFASVVITILLIYGFNAAWGYFHEARTKRQFATLFGQYVPPELVDEMARNPHKYSMDGRNAELTVLFSDVRSFTTISEGLDPKELTDLMNAYLGSMTTVIRHHRGTLDKYIGDAIMAFWGAPVGDPQHARNAVLSALEMQEELLKLNDTFHARGWPALQIGVGINTGTMTVGDMGSKLRKAYTVMGDAVNLGARLEGITKEYGVGILVGESTRKQCPDFLFREVDRVRVKGKGTPVAIFEPLGIERQMPQEIRREAEIWSIALGFYRQQQWEFAENALRELADISPATRLYKLYLERVAQLRTDPPPSVGWDGVTNFKTK